MQPLLLFLVAATGTGGLSEQLEHVLAPVGTAMAHAVVAVASVAWILCAGVHVALWGFCVFISMPASMQCNQRQTVIETGHHGACLKPTGFDYP